MKVDVSRYEFHLSRRSERQDIVSHNASPYQRSSEWRNEHFNDLGVGGIGGHYETGQPGSFQDNVIAEGNQKAAKAYFAEIQIANLARENANYLKGWNSFRDEILTRIRNERGLWIHKETSWKRLSELLHTSRIPNSTRVVYGPPPQEYFIKGVRGIWAKWHSKDINLGQDAELRKKNKMAIMRHLYERICLMPEFILKVEKHDGSVSVSRDEETGNPRKRLMMTLLEPPFGSLASDLKWYLTNVFKYQQFINLCEKFQIGQQDLNIQINEHVEYTVRADVSEAYKEIMRANEEDEETSEIAGFTDNQLIYKD